MTDPDRVHVVVTFSGSQCDEYPDMKCITGVYGPFTADEAYAFHQNCLDWMRPHTMTLTTRDRL